MSIFRITILSNYVLVVYSICMPNSRYRSEDLPKDESSHGLVFFNASYISDCECGTKYTCVRKCCDEDYIIADDERMCVRNTSIQLSVPIYKFGNVIIDDDRLVDFRYVSGVNECLLDEDPDNFYTADMDEFYVQKDGKLWIPHMNTYFKLEHYCIEFDEDDGPVAILCSMKYDIQGLEISKRITVIGMMISLPFLLITFSIYAILPLRNLHGKALMCYIFSLFITYLLFVIIQLNQEFANVSAATCTSVAMTFMYFFEASFFWMNVMCIDIYLTFSGSKIILSERKRIELKRFIYYSIYAWGIPILLVALTLTVSYLVKPNAWYNPGIFDQECWLNDGIPTFLYLYLPMAIVIIANIVLFSITAHKIRTVRKETAIFKGRDSGRSKGNDDRMRFGVYVKLFLVMGVNWSFEIITWAIDWQIENVPSAVWYATDLCNALFGLLIFIIFVCNKKVWKLLKAKCYKVTGKPPPTEITSEDVTLEDLSSK